MAPDLVVRILSQIASALVAVHARGLVHRDVKPANVCLGDDGSATLIDFGLVCTVGEDDARLYCGTPAFSSPEQITAPGQVGAHSDIYSLGALAYYLLTGKPVFEADGIVEVCLHHLSATAPRLSETCERPVPAALDELIAQCLRKNPADRPTAASVHDCLRSLADTARAVPAGTAELASGSVLA